MTARLTPADDALASAACAPAVGWASGPLGAVQAADREIARQTAARARAVAEFAATRPASADRQPGQPGCMSAERRAARPEVLADVSEWAAQELVVALSITAEAAEALLARSLTLVHRLPGTLAALETGALHAGQLWAMLDKVAAIADPQVRARVEAELLAWVAGRAVTTPAQLSAKALRVVAVRDARAAARRLVEAVRERGVFARRGGAEGMAECVALLTEPETQALLDALGRYADALEDSHLPVEQRRSRGQKMADCLLDLVLRPGETDLPPIQVQLLMVASVQTMAGGDQPGEIGGQPVPAEVCRALARAFGLLPEPVTPEDDTPSGAPAPTQAAPAAAAGRADQQPVADPHGAADPRATTCSDGAVGDVEPGTDEPRPEELEPAQAAAIERALAAWWARVEERALRGQWDGAPAPSPGELERIWAEEAAWRDLPPAGELLDPQTPDPYRSSPAAEWSVPDSPAAEWFAPNAPAAESPEPEWPVSESSAREPSGRPPDGGAGRWAAADAAVETAGAALLELRRALDRARRAVQRAEIADAADEAAWQASPAGRISAAADSIAAMAHAGAEQRAALTALLDATGGGGLVDRPRIAIVDALTGALLALTDGRELRRRSACARPACRRHPAACTHDLHDQPGLQPPPPTEAYRPGAALDRWVRARDRRCRFPGCRRRVPRGGELDHDRPWPDGPTSADNLVGYCTANHRGKHQAPGWRHELAPDGTLTVTTPTGLVAVTPPPPY